MDRMKIVIIDDNERSQTALHFLFVHQKTHKVIALLKHGDPFKDEIFQSADVAIIVVKNTDSRTIDTIRFIKEKYSLKILALPTYLMDAMVEQLKSLEVDGLLSKNRANPDRIHEALDQISKGGKYYNLIDK